MVEVPDEYGLSSDSLRGSAHLIRHDIVGADTEGDRVRRDTYTGNVLTREPLSDHEVTALRNIGILVDNDGNQLRPDEVVDTRYAPRYPNQVPGFPTPVETLQAPPASGPERLTESEWLARYRATERTMGDRVVGHDTTRSTTIVPPVAPVSETTTTDPTVSPFGVSEVPSENASSNSDDESDRDVGKGE